MVGHLSPKQRALYDFIALYWGRFEMAPTYHAMHIATGISTGNLHAMVRRMVKKGALEMTPRVSRSVRCRPL